MSTFHPVTSSLANFKNTISTISTTRFFVYISCSHQDKNQRLSWHHSSHSLGSPRWTPSQHGEPTYTRESETQCSGGSKISTFHPVASSLANYNGTISTDDLYNSTLLSCYMCYQTGVAIWGCGQFCLHYSLLSTYWVISAYFLAVLEISVCAY